MDGMTQAMRTTCELYRANPMQSPRPIRRLQMYRTRHKQRRCPGQLSTLTNDIQDTPTRITTKWDKTWDKTWTWTDNNGSDLMDLQLHLQDINIQMDPQGAGQTNNKQTNRNQIFTDP